MTTTTDLMPVRVAFENKAGFSRRKIVNRIMLTITGIFTVFAIIPLVWIIAYVVIKGAYYITPSFFTQMPRPLGVAGGGVLHAIEGTILLSLLATLFAVPPAILAAIYVANHPNTILGVLTRFATDVLSGVPTIVIGLFGYALVVKQQGHYSALAGGIALAIVMFPTVLRTTEEMIKLVPQSMREASLALGAAEWKTNLSVILPAAANGIITGILLGMARASGETAPLLFTALGNENYEVGRIVTSGIANRLGLIGILEKIFEQPVDSLPLTLWKYAQQPYPERINQAWAVAFVLLLFVLLTNIIARLWVQRRTSRMQGK
jgi:phosphate transport system permease protein